MKRIFIVCFILSSYFLFSDVIARIPFYVTEDNIMIAQGIVNSVNGYYVFDTGANVFLTKSNIDSLPVMQRRTNLNIVGSSLRTRVHTLSGFSISGVNVNGDFPIISTDESDISIYNAGVIPMSAFNDYITEISFSTSSIILRNEVPEYFDSWVPMVEVRNNCPGFLIRVNGRDVPVLLDTGSDESFVFPSEDEFLSDSIKVQVSEKDKNNNRRPYDDFYYNQFKTVEFLGITLDDKIFQIDTKTDIITVGTKALKFFDFVLDYNEQKIYYKYNGSENLFDILLSSKLISLGILNVEHSSVDNAHRVSRISEGSPAWLAGIRIGDKILEINGITNEYFSLNILKNIFSTPLVDSEIKITIERGEDKKEIVVSPAVLLE